MALIAPKYFAGGESVLQNACLDMSNWPPIQAGECIQLPLLAATFQTYIPSLTSANLQQPYSLMNGIPLKQQTNDSKDSSFENTNAIETIKQDNYAVVNSDSNDDEQCVENANKIDGKINRESSSKLTEQSREDILDSYKQSKEILLAQNVKLETDSQCDSKNNEMLDTNAIDLENDNNGDDGDLDDDFDGNHSDIKNNETSNNTQSEQSTNIERPLRILNVLHKTPIVLSSVHEIDIFRSLYTVLSYTHLLWELSLTAEPIVVMGTSPSDCSHMVQSLMRLGFIYCSKLISLLVMFEYILFIV